MLVLSRKKDEAIIINGNIIVKIVHVDRGKVRIGIEAPVEIPVHRLEIWEAICKGKEEPQC